jgi:hypothetical protein
VRRCGRRLSRGDRRDNSSLRHCGRTHAAGDPTEQNGTRRSRVSLASSGRTSASSRRHQRPLAVSPEPRVQSPEGESVLDVWDEARDAVRWKSCAGRPPVGICVLVTRPAALRAALRA